MCDSESQRVNTLPFSALHCIKVACHNLMFNTHITYTHTYTYAGDVILVTDGLRQQPVSDLPREDRRTLSLVLGDLMNNLWCGDSRLAATDGTGTDGPGLVVATEYLTDATVRHLQDAGDVARSRATVGQLHDALTRRVR